MKLSNEENGMFFTENDDSDVFPNASTVEKSYIIINQNTQIMQQLFY